MHNKLGQDWPEPRAIVEILNDAGGEIIGRTRLQKFIYILSTAGLEDNFSFSYYNFGPYSDELANMVQVSKALGYITENEENKGSLASYFIYKTSDMSINPKPKANSARQQLAKIIKDTDSVKLELAATALYFYTEGNKNPWKETAVRKELKARNGRLEEAKRLYQELRRVETPIPLPCFTGEISS